MTFLKKHWKKIVMAVFACFWAGCDNDSETEVQALYGCPDDVCDDEPVTDSSFTVIALYGVPEFIVEDSTVIGSCSSESEESSSSENESR